MQVYQIVFSPTGGTEKAAEMISSGLDALWKKTALL